MTAPQTAVALKPRAAPYDVCVITTIHQDFDNRIYHRQINALIDAGLSVCVVAPWDFTKRKRADYDFVATEMPGSRLSRPLHGWKTYQAVRTIDAAVYIFHDNDFLPFAWLLRTFGGRTVVYDAHENIPEDILYGKDWIPKILREPLSVGYRFMEETVVRKLGRTIVAAESLQRRLSRLPGVEVALVRNYPNFVDPGPDTPHERAVIYTGELTADYGLFSILDMAREIKRRGLDLKIRVIDRFSFDMEMRARTLAAIRDDDLPIEVLQSVPPESMPGILSKGCIGISPSLDLPNKASGPPTKMFEYFLFGLVVVGSDIAGTRIILGDGDLGIMCPPTDIPAWVDAFERILTDPVMAQGYRDRARAAVLSRFTWQQERQVLTDYVAKLAARPAVRRSTG